MIKDLQVNVDYEVPRICKFINSSVGGKAIVGVSGGIDSDVTARLCAKALGIEQFVLFTVIQEDMDHKHLENARQLALDLGVALREFPFQHIPHDLIRIMDALEPLERFSSLSILDVGKAKNSLRTFIHSMYAERGYTVIGCGNRTEIETGFYLAFGDGLSHVAPIAHLYKTQVLQIASQIGTRQTVLTQAPSAGYWRGETDLKDLAFWLFNGEPVQEELVLSTEDLEAVEKIAKELSFERIDIVLSLFEHGFGADFIKQEVDLSYETIEMLIGLLKAVPSTKGRLLNVQL